MEPAVANFTNIFIKKAYGQWDSPYAVGNSIAVSAIEQILASILYECASQEKLDMLPIYLKLFQDLWSIGQSGQLLLGNQMKLMLKLTSQKFVNSYRENGLVNRLVNPEIVESVYQGLLCKLDLYLELYGIEMAKEFLLSGKFEAKHFERTETFTETNEKNRRKLSTQSASRNRDTFAKLLVLHQVLSEGLDASINSLQLHDSTKLTRSNTVNPVQKLMNAKNQFKSMDHNIV